MTGKLGEVMQESVNTSLSWIKANAKALGITKSTLSSILETVEDNEITVGESSSVPKIFKDIDLHVHFPAAATPKDGPSAGVTITVALVSLFTGRKVRSDFAMTGEVSLQGLALPVGGIKEKVIAAHQNGIKQVIIPKQNARDLKEIPKELRQKLKIHTAEKVQEYIDLALEKHVHKSGFSAKSLIPKIDLMPKL